MSKLSNQKLKLMYLREILENNTDEEHTITVVQMIDELERRGIPAERKSVYDDIEELIFYGVDIETIKSKGTGYYVASRTFELAELKLLVDSVQSSKFLTQKKSNELISKIETLCSHYDAVKLQRQVFVTNRIKNMNESIYYNVDKIHTAIMQNKQIRFHYFEYTVNKERKLRKNGEFYLISPYALMWDDENYYLLGFDSDFNIIKHYRVDKILNIELLEETRLGEECFAKIDLGGYSKKMFSMYGGVEEYVKIEFENKLIGVVIDRFGKDVTVIKTDDNHFSVNFKVAVSPQFFAWVFSFGSGAKIISPKSIIDSMKQHIEEALKMY